MWYYVCNFAAETAQLGALGPGDVRQGPVCYAESDDGIHWRRPNLGQLKGNLIPCYHVTGARGWGGYDRRCRTARARVRQTSRFTMTSQIFHDLDGLTSYHGLP